MKKYNVYGNDAELGMIISEEFTTVQKSLRDGFFNACVNQGIAVDCSYLDVILDAAIVEFKKDVFLALNELPWIFKVIGNDQNDQSVCVGVLQEQRGAVSCMNQLKCW